MKIILRLILFYLLKFLPSETYLIGFIQTKMKQKTQRVPQASVYLSLNSGRTICGSFLWSGRLLPRKQIKRSVNSYCSSINRSANSLYPFVLKWIFRSVAFFIDEWITWRVLQEKYQQHLQLLDHRHRYKGAERWFREINEFVKEKLYFNLIDLTSTSSNMNWRCSSFLGWIYI